MTQIEPSTSPVPPLPAIVQLVLAWTGEPVDLIHIEDGEAGRRYCVERPCGELLTISEDQLSCRGFRLH